MASKYYKLNKEKKTITIDDKITPTAADEKDVQRYVTAGYIIRHKSEARAKAAKARAEKNGFGKKKTADKE